jgi:hypothetical protein
VDWGKEEREGVLMEEANISSKAFLVINVYI